MSDTSLKRIERALRRGVIGVIRRTFRRKPVASLLELPPCASILLIRNDRLGDAIISTPVMNLLRERFPDARIDIVLGRRNAAIASLLPSIDHAHVVQTGISGLLKSRAALRARRYDVVVNLHFDDSSSAAILTIASGSRHRVGFEGDLGGIYDFAVPHPSHRPHIVEATSLLLAPFGIEPIVRMPVRANDYLRLNEPSGSSNRHTSIGSEEPLRIVFSISSSDSNRSWPDEKVIELIRRLQSEVMSVDVIGTPADSSRVRSIVDASGAQGVTATESFAAFVTRLNEYDVVITPQTSTVHVSSALRKATVLLNTDSESDRQWTPWGVPQRVLSAGARVADLSVESVVNAVRSLAAELTGSSNRS